VIPVTKMTELAAPGGALITVGRVTAMAGTYLMLVTLLLIAVTRPTVMSAPPGAASSVILVTGITRATLTNRPIAASTPKSRAKNFRGRGAAVVRGLAA